MIPVDWDCYILVQDWLIEIAMSHTTRIPLCYYNSVTLPEFPFTNEILLLNFDILLHYFSSKHYCISIIKITLNYQNPVILLEFHYVMFMTFFYITESYHVIIPLTILEIHFNMSH